MLIVILIDDKMEVKLNHICFHCDYFFKLTTIHIHNLLFTFPKTLNSLEIIQYYMCHVLYFIIIIVILVVIIIIIIFTNIVSIHIIIIIIVIFISNDIMIIITSVIIIIIFMIIIVITIILIIVIIFIMFLFTVIIINIVVIIIIINLYLDYFHYNCCSLNYFLLPSRFSDIIQTVPRMAAVLYNDSCYIAHNCTLITHIFKEDLGKVDLSLQDNSGFIDFIPKFRYKGILPFPLNLSLSLSWSFALFIYI